MDLQRRVDGLERLTRRLAVALAGSWILIGLIALAGARRAPGTVEASLFVLVGPDGKDRARLGSADTGTVLSFYDATGTKRLLLGAVEEGHSGLYVIGKDSKATATFGIEGKAQPGIELIDQYDRKVFKAP